MGTMIINPYHFVVIPQQYYSGTSALASTPDYGSDFAYSYDGNYSTYAYYDSDGYANGTFTVTFSQTRSATKFRYKVDGHSWHSGTTQIYFQHYNTSTSSWVTDYDHNTGSGTTLWNNANLIEVEVTVSHNSNAMRFVMVSDDNVMRPYEMQMFS